MTQCCFEGHIKLGARLAWWSLPYANFYAWFIVLCSCSALLWRVRSLTVRPGWRGPLAVLGALLGSVVILTLLDELVVQYDSHGGIVWLPVTIVVIGALVVVVGISLAMVAVSLALHSWLVQRKLVLRQFPSQQSALSSETFGMKKIPPG